MKMKSFLNLEVKRLGSSSDTKQRDALFMSNQIPAGKNPKEKGELMLLP